MDCERICDSEWHDGKVQRGILSSKTIDVKNSKNDASRNDEGYIKFKKNSKAIVDWRFHNNYEIVADM
jgi:hypothetical protein